MRKVPQEIGSLPELASRFVDRFEALGARVERSSNTFSIVSLNASSVLRRFSRPLFCLITTADLGLSTLKQDRHWLDSALVEELPGRSRRSGLVPIIISGPRFQTAASALRDSQLLASEHTIIDFALLDTGGDTSEALRAALLKSAPVDAITPYSIATATLPNMLFGRQKEIKQILQSRPEKIT